jgi:hypothetical protein
MVLMTILWEVTRRGERELSSLFPALITHKIVLEILVLPNPLQASGTLGLGLSLGQLRLLGLP